MALGGLFVEIGGSIAGLRAAMGEAVTEIKGVEAATGRAATGLERSSKIGVAAAGALAVGLVAAGGESLKMAADFETSNNKLVSTAGESTKVLSDVVAPGLLKMAGEVGYSAQQLSDGMYTVESGGFHGAAGLNLLKAAAQGAKAENADLGVTTNALTTVMQDYKGAIDDPAKAMSQLVAITGTGKMTFQDLAGSLSSVLPKASALNIGLGQVGGAIATMTQHGESADLATQHLNHTIGALNQPLGPARAGMQQFGIDVQDLTLNMGDDKRGLVGTVGLLQNAIVSKMGPAGTIAIDTLKKSGQAAKDAEEMLKGMPPALAAASKNFLDGSMSAKDYTKAIKGMGADGFSMGSQFKALVTSSHGFSDALKSGKPEIVNFAGALKQIGGDQTTADTLLQLMGKNFDEYSQNVKTASDATTGADGSVKGFADTQETLNFKLDSAKASMGAFAISIGNALMPAAKVAADVLAAVAHWLAENSIAGAAVAIVIGVVVTGAIALFAMKSVKGLADVAVEMTKGIATMVMWVGRQLFGYTAAGAAATTEAGVEEAANATRNNGLIVNAAKGAWWLTQKIGHYTAVAAAATMNGARIAAVWAAESAKSLASATIDGAKWVAVKLGQYIAIAAGAVVQSAIAIAAWVAENAVAIVASGGIILVIGLIVAAVLWCIAHWEDIKRVAGIVWDWVSARFQEAAAWIGARIDDIVNFVVGIGRIVDIAMQAMGDFFTTIVNKGLEVVQWFIDLPGNILNALGDMGRLLWDAGVNLVIGLWNGLASMGQWLWNTIMGWIKSVVPGPILAALGISSPSKLTHWVGQMTAQGLANGMIANAKTVTDASKHVANQAVAAMTGTAQIDATVRAGYALSTASLSGAAPLGGTSAPLGTPAGSAGGSAGTTVIVQGSIVDTAGLFNALQQESTRYNGRNTSNGLSTTRI